MKSLTKMVMVLATVGAAGGVLLAQPAEDQGKAGEPPAERRQAELTGPEMIRQMNAYSTQVNGDTRIVVLLQRKVRAQQDVIKLNCVNDALLQIKALRNIFDDNRNQFVSAGDEVAEMRGPFRAAADNVTAIRALRDRANVCAGEGELASDTRNDFVRPDIPDDPSEDLFPSDEYVEPPGFASPFN